MHDAAAGAQRRRCGHLLQHFVIQVAPVHVYDIVPIGWGLAAGGLRVLPGDAAQGTLPAYALGVLLRRIRHQRQLPSPGNGNRRAQASGKVGWSESPAAPAPVPRISRRLRCSCRLHRVAARGAGPGGGSRVGPPAVRRCKLLRAWMTADYARDWSAGGPRACARGSCCVGSPFFQPPPAALPGRHAPPRPADMAGVWVPDRLHVRHNHGGCTVSQPLAAAGGGHCWFLGGGVPRCVDGDSRQAPDV